MKRTVYQDFEIEVPDDTTLADHAEHLYSCEILVVDAPILEDVQFEELK